MPIEEEEEDGEPLVKGEDDIPKGCWLVGLNEMCYLLTGLHSLSQLAACGQPKKSMMTLIVRTSSAQRFVLKYISIIIDSVL